MQFEDREQRNERPKEASRNLPMAVLLVLVSIICALLYIGWKYMSDDTSASDDLTAAPADTVANYIKSQPVYDESEVTNDESSEETVSNALPEVAVPTVGTKKEAAASKETTTAKAEKPVEEKPKEEKPKTAAVAAVPSGGEIYAHTVGENETFFGIANRFNIKKETLKALNPNVEENGIKVGVTKLKIRIKAVHTVGPGDILRVVSKKYNVPVALIMQANKKAKNFAERGEKLIIPYATKE